MEYALVEFTTEMASLVNKVFCVTGAASGMGLATAKLLLSSGASARPGTTHHSYYAGYFYMGQHEISISVYVKFAYI